jgi:acylphosphatase
LPTIHLLIKGTVQGVGYRASAKEQADRLGLTGWVRNTLEGDVEITTTGDPLPLQQFIQWCHRGPAHAHVIDLLTQPLPETSFPDFSIHRSR